MAPRWATVTELIGQKLDGLARRCRQARRFGQGQKAFDSVNPLGCDDTELAQVSANGVALKAHLRCDGELKAHLRCDGELSLLAHQKVPRPMGHQNSLLILGLDRRRAGGTPLA